MFVGKRRRNSDAVCIFVRVGGANVCIVWLTCAKEGKNRGNESRVTMGDSFVRGVGARVARAGLQLGKAR